MKKTLLLLMISLTVATAGNAMKRALPHGTDLSNEPDKKRQRLDDIVPNAPLTSRNAVITNCAQSDIMPTSQQDYIETNDGPVKTATKSCNQFKRAQELDPFWHKIQHEFSDESSNGDETSESESSECPCELPLPIETINALQQGLNELLLEDSKKEAENSLSESLLRTGFKLL